MIEENERAAKFMQAIQRDGEKRRTAIIQAIDEEIAAELEKVKTAAAAKARQMGDYEKVRLQEETNRKLSHSVVETGAELAARRSEIAQQVFDACEEKLAAFTAKADYADYLKKSAEALLTLLHADKAVFYARPQDVEAAKSAVPAGCEVTADATIRLGGLRAKSGAVEADDTLDMKLEAQKDWFLQNSGMSIAL